MVDDNIYQIFTHQENVGAEFQDTVNAWQLLKHDGVTDPTEEFPHKLPNHQNHRGIQTHNAAYSIGKIVLLLECIYVIT